MTIGFSIVTYRPTFKVRRQETSYSIFRLTSLTGIPWFLAPRAYAARKRVLDSFQLWQQYARDHFEESSIGADGDDPYWGSSFFRKRQGMFLEMDGHNYADISSQDFGFIWAYVTYLVSQGLFHSRFRSPTANSFINQSEEFRDCYMLGHL